jgi:hypothetical protein
LAAYLRVWAPFHFRCCNPEEHPGVVGHMLLKGVLGLIEISFARAAFERPCYRQRAAALQLPDGEATRSEWQSYNQLAALLQVPCSGATCRGAAIS